jgi:hypothetical protein
MSNESIQEFISERSSIDIVEEQFKIYGEYVNLHRHIPYIYDGLKPSYRRLIQASLDIAKDKLVKTASIVGNTLMKWHPHGDASLNPVVSELVKKGIFDGRGNHGAEFLIGEDASPAAPRYTEAGLNKSYRDIMCPVLKYVPTFLNELGYEEYEYMPSPIPLGLMFGYIGIAVGTGCKLPSFTSKSLLEAYLNDDPLLLKQSDGLIIDNPDNLKVLWKTGRSYLKYHVNNYRLGNEIIIEGKHGPLNLNYDWLLQLRSDGRVDYDDLTSDDYPKLSWHKMPRVQYPTTEEMEAKIRDICKGQECYYVRVVHNDQVRDIGLYDWIDITYKNYKNLYSKYLSDKISNIKFDIEVFKNANTVSREIIESKSASADSIAKKLNIGVDIVNSIMDKTLRSIRNMLDSDYTKKISDLEVKIKELEIFDIDKLILNSIQ